MNRIANAPKAELYIFSKCTKEARLISRAVVNNYIFVRSFANFLTRKALGQSGDCELTCAALHCHLEPDFVVFHWLDIEATHFVPKF